MPAPPADGSTALIAVTNGSINGSSTWAPIEPTGATLSDTDSTYIEWYGLVSGAFTPGAVTVDGIAVHFNTADNGYTAALVPGTVTNPQTERGLIIAGTSVTRGWASYNSISGEGDVGWQFFQFNAPVTLSAATAYKFIIYSAGAWLDSTYGFCLRLAGSTRAPNSGDKLIIANSQGNSGGPSIYTVTMDNTDSSFQYGDIAISGGCTLAFGTTASTAYYLKLGGNIKLRHGILQLGSSGSRLPTSSSATIEFNTASPGQYGITSYGGTCSIWGDNSRQWFTALTSTAAASQAVINVADATGWQIGDTLVLAATGTTYSEAETKTIASLLGNQVTLNSNLVTTKTYHADILSEVVNLTKNITIRGQTTTNTCYMHLAQSTSGTIDGIRLRYSGSNSYNSYANQTLAIMGYTTMGSPPTITINQCAITDYQVTAGTVWMGAGDPGVSTNQTVTLSNSALINLGNCGSLLTTNGGATAGFTLATSNQVVSNCVFMGPYNGAALNLLSTAITTDYLYISCGNSPNASSGIVILNSNTPSTNTNLNHWYMHSCASNTSYGTVYFASQSTTTINNLTIRNVTGNGVMLSCNYPYTVDGFSISNCTYALRIAFSTTADSQYGTGFHLLDGTISSTTYAVGIEMYNYVPIQARFNNCTINTIATSEINLVAANQMGSLIFDNCTMSPTTPRYTNLSNLGPVGTVAVQTSTLQYLQTAWGTITNDTTTYKNRSPSMRITPTSASTAQTAGVTYIAANAGDVITIGCWMYKSTSPAYTGAQPYITLEYDYSLGIPTDVTTAAALGNGVWEYVTVSTTVTNQGVVQVLVGCAGTAGYVDFDSFTMVAPTADTTHLGYWRMGTPSLVYGK